MNKDSTLSVLSSPNSQALGGRIVVIGNGMVGHRFCEKISEYDSHRIYHLLVIGEEPRPAYDRLHLTDYFKDRSIEKLSLGSQDFYRERGISLLVGQKVVRIDRSCQTITTDQGISYPYDHLVFATGSTPFVPSIPGVNKPGVFVYRTIEDIEAILAYGAEVKTAAVLGGGLLGLEAARALRELGLETHVLELAPRLMPRQLDPIGSAILHETIVDLGVHVHLNVQLVSFEGETAVDRITFAHGKHLPVGMVVISAGIKPRDELARDAGLPLGDRGGIIVDDRLKTKDPSIYAIGEVALHRGVIYGLVAPGYEMADTLAKNLMGGDQAFTGGDLSSKLKLMGTDVATFGNPLQTTANTKVLLFEDQVHRVYKKLLIDTEQKILLGGILVGDAKEFTRFQFLSRSNARLSDGLEELGMIPGTPLSKPGDLPDEVQVCSCHSVLAGSLRGCVRNGTATLSDLKKATKAGTGCGGCIPVVTDILTAELRASGHEVRSILCEHFPYTRVDLFQIIAAKRIRTFGQLIKEHGTGHGCEICKPTVASIFASIFNEPILKKEHRPLQDSNDRFLANLQKDGTYSVIPRIPGGEITAEKLVTLGKIAKRWGLHTKITGGQRIDMLGAKLEALPLIWQALVSAGFESGHAYGKAMRTVKSCVGSDWCRFGVQDSTRMAIRVENRYKGIRSPHKLKSAVSGCVRECAEAQSKDFGFIATDKGWNVYVCGNGGAHPRHADLLVTNVDADTAIRLMDRFIMFYIRTADRLTRTSVWLDKMEGGIDRLRQIIVDDALGIAADLEQEMAALVGSYECEWAGVLRSPERLATFKTNSQTTPILHPISMPNHPGKSEQKWVRMAKVWELPTEGGLVTHFDEYEIALFRFPARNEWFAVDNLCPHQQQPVLARGILGDSKDCPKVACPLHKTCFDLRTGTCLTADLPALSTYPVKVEGDDVWVSIPAVAIAAPIGKTRMETS